MARIKIDYGIDLGTTNSAICRMEKGEPVIIKSDIQKDTMPSCVSFTKRKSIRIGETAFNDYKSNSIKAFIMRRFDIVNTFLEFKRTMATTTKYHSSFMDRDYSSEELSSEVLKTLKSFVLDENIKSVVVTVPAKFTVNQKTATLEAASMAGFTKCELLQEPIAASMAYGLNSECKNGIWMVFDFGGGTFDAALVKVEDGIMQVFDTEGDNYLGGKNLDYAIVDDILVPYLKENFEIDSILADEDKKKMLREAMKVYAESAKNQLSFKDSVDIISDLGDLGEDDCGDDIELDLTIAQSQLHEVIKPYFQKAVDICKNLLKRNRLTGNDINKLILVGGPTHSSLIRQMLKDQITPNVDVSIDPMTAVATGAALYASTIDAEVNDEDLVNNEIKLELGYESTSVESSEWVSVKLSDDNITNVFVEFIRNDGAWSSGKVEVDKNGNVIEVALISGKPNSFSVKAYDEQGNVLPCFPSEFTIIQGTSVGAAPLPYNIGIAVWDETKKRGVFKMATGLEKNKPVPAIGIVNGLKTSSQLRPGIESDTLKIPVYQTDDYSEAEGRSAYLFEHVSDVIITGEDVDELVPADSPVDVTLKVNSSEQMLLEVFFNASELTVEKKLDTSKKHSIEDADSEIERMFNEGQRSINNLSDSDINIDALQDEFNAVKEDSKNNTERKAVLQHLKEVLRKVEKAEFGSEWDRLEKKIRSEFERLEMAQKNLGNDDTQRLVEQLRSQSDEVIRTKNVSLGQDVLEHITDLFVYLTLVYQCMGLIKHYNECFERVNWKDRSRARHLIDRGLEEINNQPTVEKLHPIACEIINLMPDDEAANAGGLLH